MWRKPEQGPLPAEAEPEFAKIAGNAAATPERLRIPWQPYPSTSAKRVWEWIVVVADPARRLGPSRPWDDLSNAFRGYRQVTLNGQGIIDNPID